MAGASFLALLDDIATVLDDVAVLSKVAAKKSAGVLGDDLAVNAEQGADLARRDFVNLLHLLGVHSHEARHANLRGPQLVHC